MSKQVILHSMRFEVAEKARKVASLEAILMQFEGIASELARQIAFEEARTRIHDPTNVLYSTFANATAQRRANLLKSIAELRTRLIIAKRAHEQANEELRALEPIDLRDANQHRNKEELTSPEAGTN